MTQQFKSEGVDLLPFNQNCSPLRGYPRLHNSAFRAMGTFRNRLWVRFDAMSWSGENQPTGEKVGFLTKKTEKWVVLPTFYSVTTRSIFVILVSIDA